MAGEHKGEVKAIEQCIVTLKKIDINAINDDITRSLIQFICKKLYECSSLNPFLTEPNPDQPRYNEYKVLLALAIYAFTENPIPDFVHFNEGYGLLNGFNTRQRYIMTYVSNPKSILKRIKFMVGVYYMMHISEPVFMIRTWEDKLAAAIQSFKEAYEATTSLPPTSVGPRLTF